MEIKESSWNILVEITLINNLDNSLRREIPYSYAIDIIKLLTEMLKQWTYMEEILSEKSVVTTILDIVSSRCPERIPSKPDSTPEFSVTYQESSIDITNSPDLLLCECFRFLGLLVQKRANFYYLSVREACDYLIVFPFISGFPEASDIALEMIVQITQDFSNEKMELFSGEFRKLDKFHPIMDLALHGNEMAWGVIANLMNAGFLIKEFYEHNDFVDFINTVLTQTIEGIKTLESKEELDEEEIQEKDQMLAIHRLAMGVLASATYDRTAAKYGELYAQSNCLDVILEDILGSPIKIRKEACITLTHLLDFQGETIIHSLFEKNPEFPLEALRNLPATKKMNKKL